MILTLLCGPAFSGKSTLARALEARGAVRIALDDLLADKNLSPGDGLPAHVWEEASQQACDRLRETAGHRRDAVLDDTLCFRFLRERYRVAGQECGYNVRLVVVRVDEAEIHRRIADNDLRPRRRGIRSGVLARHLQEFQWPTTNELPVELDGTWPVDRQLEVLLAGPYASHIHPR